MSQISAPASSRRRAATNSYYSSYTNGNSIYEEDSNEKYPTAQFVCEVCGGRYKTKTGLNYHYNSQHAGITSQVGFLILILVIITVAEEGFTTWNSEGC